VTPLRWTLGIAAALGTVGWLLLVMAASDFRRSFGASPVDAARAALLPIVMALVLASVLFPASRGLLHVTAGVLALGAAGCLLLLKEAPFVATMGLAFLALWFLYYWRSVSA